MGWIRALKEGTPMIGPTLKMECYSKKKKKKSSSRLRLGLQKYYRQTQSSTREHKPCFQQRIFILVCEFYSMINSNPQCHRSFAVFSFIRFWNLYLVPLLVPKLLKLNNRNIPNEWWLRAQVIMNFRQYFKGMALEVEKNCNKRSHVFLSNVPSKTVQRRLLSITWG